jgi:tripartite-type tricarboxylate transporter receptor subunit TctC
MRRLRSAFVITAALLYGTTSACAQAGGGFYSGKQLTLVVGSAAGTIYDNYARLLARHFPQHIAGNPKIIVQNMPGAGGLKVANYIAEVAPRDGTVFGSTLNAMATAPLTVPAQAKYDGTKLGWIGSITNDPFIAYVWSTAPITSLEQAKTTQIIMGGTGVSASNSQLTVLANEMFGFKFKLVPGYNDSVSLKLAIERGEVQGTFATSWRELKSTNPDWVPERKIRVIAQFGLERIPDLPDVPMFLDQAKTDADHQALVFVLSRQEYGKPFFGPPGIPAERLAILRAAFDAMIKDPEFLKDAQASNMGVDRPMSGAALTEMVTKVSATPKDVITRLQKLLGNAL